ncbi:hypothetical protein FNU79_14465 [Deinococcus detaillensis]|uniref:Uncharacterized protein n=1 Tax=Deinococcus detaillensis TaxID=2592048 RepID=A0A553UNH9_9DEIO|nr:hypothetical protein [Deinococcus detaillensis]TSA81774.1 hypothetical protein FNU79_14465 [Deinococcus detaillensis]
MSVPDGLLWVLGTVTGLLTTGLLATVLLALRRPTRPAYAAALVPIYATCAGNSALKEQRYP